MNVLSESSHVFINNLLQTLVKTRKRVLNFNVFKKKYF